MSCVSLGPFLCIVYPSKYFQWEVFSFYILYMFQLDICVRYLLFVRRIEIGIVRDFLF